MLWAVSISSRFESDTLNSARPTSIYPPPTLAGAIQGNHKYCCAAERIGVMESLRGIYEVDLNKKKIHHVCVILSAFQKKTVL